MYNSVSAKPTRRGRRSEKAEDDALLEAAEQAQPVVQGQPGSKSFPKRAPSPQSRERWVAVLLP